MEEQIPEPTPDSIPVEVLEAYYPLGTASQDKILGGEINVTFLIVDGWGGKTILQRLSRIYNPLVIGDYEVVASHLRERGWEMAEILKTTAGALHMFDGSGRLWRAQSYVESTPGS